MILEGDLIEYAKNGEFDVITHSANCFCRMGRGIAPQLDKEYGCGSFPLEHSKYRGDINKLGSIDYKDCNGLIVINSYMQYHFHNPSKYGVPIDYDAMRLCFRKINYIFSGKTIGLPMIGAGLAGGDWNIIKNIIYDELKDMNIKIVLYKK